MQKPTHWKYTIKKNRNKVSTNNNNNITIKKYIIFKKNKNK